MRVSDYMTTPAISVGPDDRARHVVEMLIRHRISGLPVVDNANRPIGVVTQWHFITADLERQEKRREAWLCIMSGGQGDCDALLSALEQELGPVREFMESAILAVDQETPIDEVASLFAERGVKLAAVVQGERIVGVVTRADLMRAMIGGAIEPSGEPDLPAASQPAPPAPAIAPEPEFAPPAFSAGTLRHLVSAYDSAQAAHRRDAADSARREREARVKELLEANLSDMEWAAVIAEAKAAAARGEPQCVVLRFPAALCNDGGRLVNLPDPEWPTSLRGKPAFFYLRWREELRPLGFKLTARIADFPDGLPGDVEVALVWGR